MFFKKPPILLGTSQNAAAVREAFEATAELRRRGVTGFVLVKLTIGSTGTVESARTIMPPAVPWTRGQVIAIDTATGEELPAPPPHTLQPDLCRAAETAARKLQFQPATLLGRSVRYRGYRHGFSFDNAEPGTTRRG